MRISKRRRRTNKTRKETWRIDNNVDLVVQNFDLVWLRSLIWSLIFMYTFYTRFFWYIFWRLFCASHRVQMATEKKRLTTVNAWILSARCVFNRTTTCFCSFVRFDFFLAVDVLVCNSYTISLLPITWQHLKIFLRSTPLPLPLLFVVVLAIVADVVYFIGFGFASLYDVLFAALYCRSVRK